MEFYQLVFGGELTVRTFADLGCSPVKMMRTWSCTPTLRRPTLPSL
jgi:hypothetical protein